MRRFIIRLDDASEYMDLDKWGRMEQLLDKFGIKPIFGIIPDNKDELLVNSYEFNPDFWKLVHSWVKKGWIPAMHGYQHLYVTKEGGVNPVNRDSEFAGLSYEEQAGKIKKGWEILLGHGIKPDVFFAPSHTFDYNTLEAIKNETTIRIISDTPAWDVYNEDDFMFIPQQSGNVRNLPFRTVTFCYHPNIMDDAGFEKLETFLTENKNSVSDLNDIRSDRKRTVSDRFVRFLYFSMRKH